jgi:N-acetylmuramoyl-L-alanine amidase
LKKLGNIFAALSILLLFFLFTEIISVNCAATSPEEPIYGMMVRSWQNIDFPSGTNLSAKRLKDELGQLIDFSLQTGCNSLFFEARVEGGSLYSSDSFPSSRYLIDNAENFSIFDPLGELINIAGKNKIRVYLAIDPLSEIISDDNFAEPFAKNDYDEDQLIEINKFDIQRLMARYGDGISGIIFYNCEFIIKRHDCMVRFIDAIREVCPERTDIGVFMSDINCRTEDLSALSSSIDIVISEISQPVGLFKEGFEALLSEWSEAAGNAKFIPYYDISKAHEITGEYSNRFLIAKNNDMPSCVAGNYSSLVFGEYMQASLFFSMLDYVPDKTTQLSFEIPSQLLITRPQKELTTSLSHYSIFGASNPDVPLTLNGNEVERPSASGIFAMRLPLLEGKNEFVFKQNELTQKIIIKRISPDTTPKTITALQSMAPEHSMVVSHDENFEIRCVAPSQSQVTAEISGVSVQLTQLYSTAIPGIPAVFSGTIKLSIQPQNDIENIGPINYFLTRNQTRSQYTSNGDVYLKRQSAKAYICVDEFLASVYPDSSLTEGIYLEVYKKGTAEEIVDQTVNCYELASGGFIRKSNVKVLLDYKPPSIKSIATNYNSRFEEFVLESAGGLPYRFSDNDDGTTDLEFFGDIKLPESVATPSNIFSRIEWQNTEKGIKCSLSHDNSRSIDGLDVFYRANDTVIYVKPAPILAESTLTPLKNLVVVLDPGHGGADPGALGILGAEFPPESDLNLANAINLKNRLELLGAHVVLTRDDNQTGLTLFERMAVCQQYLPDYFISLHHNSVAESADVQNALGVEAYYYYDYSKKLGELIAKRISQENSFRSYRKVAQSYYTVTRMRYTPSILVEIAFVAHPDEYIRACDPIEISKTSNAIACALLELML